jgi:hypothetical protein
MEDVSIFYGRLIFLWLFGIFCGNLVCLHIFPFVGILYKVKSGNPVLHHGEQLGFMSKCLKKFKTCFLSHIHTHIHRPGPGCPTPKNIQAIHLSNLRNFNCDSHD